MSLLRPEVVGSVAAVCCVLALLAVAFAFTVKRRRKRRAKDDISEIDSDSSVAMGSLENMASAKYESGGS